MDVVQNWDVPLLCAVELKGLITHLHHITDISENIQPRYKLTTLSSYYNTIVFQIIHSPILFVRRVQLTNQSKSISTAH